MKDDAVAISWHIDQCSNDSSDHFRDLYTLYRNPQALWVELENHHDYLLQIQDHSIRMRPTYHPSMILITPSSSSSFRWSNYISYYHSCHTFASRSNRTLLLDRLYNIQCCARKSWMLLSAPFNISNVCTLLNFHLVFAVNEISTLLWGIFCSEIIQGSVLSPPFRGSQ